jgi:hypothetical protein
MSDTQYSEKLKNAQPKVAKALKEAIVSVKDIIAKKRKFYENNKGDPLTIDYIGMEVLGKEMENVAKKATDAINLHAQTKLLGHLDSSITKAEKARELGERLKSSKTPDTQEKVIKEIEQALSE